MRKKLFTALVVIAVICTAVLTASAVTGAPDTSPFDTSLLLPVTEKFDIERVVSSWGGGYASLTQNDTLLAEIDSSDNVEIGYTVTTDGTFFAPFIAHENNLYASNYMVLQVKNSSQPIALAIKHQAFCETVTAYIGISGNEEYPVVLVNDNGEYRRAGVEFIRDAWYIKLPADFSGYIVIPNERLTSDTSESNTEGIGDYMSLHTEQDYRFFWLLGLVLENLSDEPAELEWVNMYAVAAELDFDLPAFTPTVAPTEAPTEAPTDVASQGASVAPTEASTVAPADVASQGASVAPGQSTAAAQQSGGFPTWAWIVIAVVAVAIIVVVIVAASKKKKEN